MGEYEDRAIELGAMKRLVTKQQHENIYLLQLLRRCVVAFRIEEEHHSGIYDYYLLEEVEKELSLWKTERLE